MKRRTRWILIGSLAAVTAAVLLLFISASISGLGTPIQAARASMTAVAIPGGGIQITHQRGDVLGYNNLRLAVSNGAGRLLFQINSGGVLAPGDMVTVYLNPPLILVNGAKVPSLISGGISANPGDTVFISLTYNNPKPGGGSSEQAVMNAQAVLQN